MTPEPLKGKLDSLDYDTKGDYFRYKDIKSAVQGLIKFHEDRIEELTKQFEKLNDVALYNSDGTRIFYGTYLQDMIKVHKESIMAIEHWFEDVI